MKFKLAFGISRNSLLFLALLLVSLACGSPPPEPLPVEPKKAPQNLPITEVYQTFTQDYERTWEIIIATLTEKKIDVKMANKELGRIVTAWIPIEDKLCGVESAKEAPLDCRVQFSFFASRLENQSAAVTVKYLETCLDREQMTLVCPKSNAEKMMIRLVDTLKSNAAIP